MNLRQRTLYTHQSNRGSVDNSINQNKKNDNNNYKKKGKQLPLIQSTKVQNLLDKIQPSNTGRYDQHKENPLFTQHSSIRGSTTTTNRLAGTKLNGSYIQFNKNQKSQLISKEQLDIINSVSDPNTSKILNTQISQDQQDNINIEQQQYQSSEQLQTLQNNSSIIQQREQQNQVQLYQNQQQQYIDFKQNSLSKPYIGLNTSNIMNTQPNIYTSFNKTNHFTNKDTRHDQIEKLKYENSYLKQKVEELTQDLKEADEFKYAYEKSQEEQNFQERRILLLKAQLSKQQRYIRKQTTFIQSSRKIQKDIFCIMQFLIDNTQEDKKKIINDGKRGKIQDNETGSKTERQIDDRLNEISNALALKNLQEQQVGNDRFMQNFNSIYSKILDYQKQNLEFNKLFTVYYDSNKQKKIKFQHPIKKFIEQYGSLFPVYTIFEAFPAQQRENFSNLLTVLRGQLKSSIKGFKKMQDFDLFKSNPMYFRDMNTIQLPDILLQEDQDFSDYLRQRDQLKMIPLDYKQLNKIEGNLSSLLEKLVKFQGDFIGYNSNNLSQPIQEIVANLKYSIEELLCLGILISNDYAATNTKLAVLNKESKAYVKTMTSLDENKQRLSLKDIQEIKIQQQTEDDYLGIIAEQDVDCNNEFNEKYRSLLLNYEDLMKNVMLKETTMSQKLLNKVGYLNQQIKSIFDWKNSVLLSKEAEITFLRGQIELYKQDCLFSRQFVFRAQAEMNQFFKPIDQQLNQIYDSFVQIFETKGFQDPKQRKQFSILFKTNLKNINTNIKHILQLERGSNVLNLQNLQQEFQQKVKLLEFKSQTTKRNLQKEFKDKEI